MNSADISAHKRSTRKASAKKDSTLTPGGYRRRKANSYQSLFITPLPSTLTPGGYRRRKANSYQSLASN